MYVLEGLAEPLELSLKVGELAEPEVSIHQTYWRHVGWCPHEGLQQAS